MPYGVVDVNFGKTGPILELNSQGVSDVALLGVMIFGGEGLVLNTSDLRKKKPRVSFRFFSCSKPAIKSYLGPKFINSGVRCNSIHVILTSEASEDQRHGDHIPESEPQLTQSRFVCEGRERSN